MIRSKSPFWNPSQPPLLVHGCYHKSGTHWLRKILKKVGKQFGLPLHSAPSATSNGDPLPTSGILFDGHSRIDVAALPPFRGSHMVRDPRDIVISAYFYHLWTDESWAHRPQKKYGGRSYQAYLQQLDQEDGLLAEIDRLSALFRRMRQWNYQDPRFYEIKYEAMMAEEDRILRELFTSYGFHTEAVETSVQIGLQCGFQALTGREIGDVQEKAVLRSGKSGQWREHFTARVREAFDRSAGDLLAHLGYETNQQPKCSAA